MSEQPGVSLSSRVQLAHASIQALAEDHGVDVILVKGPTSAPGLRAVQSSGTDVDVLVRPAHSTLLVQALRSSGWELVTDFTSGSAFDHAANYYHPQWGLVDIHREFPGLERDPGGNFEQLWQRRESLDIAHYPCTVLDRTGQALVILLHAARSPHSVGSLHPDAQTAWFDRDEDERARIQELAEIVGAQTPLAVAIGAADTVRHHRDAALWIWFADGGSRLDEWHARLRVAPTFRAKSSIILRSFTVNEYYLAQKLGHSPSRHEIRREFFRRLGQGAREGGAILGRQLRREWGRARGDRTDEGPT